MLESISSEPKALLDDFEGAAEEKEEAARLSSALLPEQAVPTSLNQELRDGMADKRESGR
jgi:hypothetical protein